MLRTLTLAATAAVAALALAAPQAAHAQCTGCGVQQVQPRGFVRPAPTRSCAGSCAPRHSYILWRGRTCDPCVRPSYYYAPVYNYAHSPYFSNYYQTSYPYYY